MSTADNAYLIIDEIYLIQQHFWIVFFFNVWLDYRHFALHPSLKEQTKNDMYFPKMCNSLSTYSLNCQYFSNDAVNIGIW